MLFEERQMRLLGIKDKRTKKAVVCPMNVALHWPECVYGLVHVDGQEESDHKPYPVLLPP